MIIRHYLVLFKVENLKMPGKMQRVYTAKSIIFLFTPFIYGCVGKDWPFQHLPNTRSPFYPFQDLHLSYLCTCKDRLFFSL